MTTLSDLPWRSTASGISLQPDEKIADFCSTHWVKYAAPALFYVLLEGSGLALLFGLRGLPPAVYLMVSLVIMAVLLLVHHWFFRRLLGRALDTIVITNKRIIIVEANLWYNDDSAEISAAQIHTVEAYKKGLLQHLFNYGTIWFDTGGSSFDEGRLVPLIPNPHHRANLIANILKEYAHPGSH